MKIIIETDECFECGKKDSEIHMHHIIPRVRNGKKTIPLCVKCHGLVHGLDFVNIRYLREEGIRKAKEKGIYKGRCLNTTETDEDFLKKYPEVIKALKNKISIRKTAKLCNVSNATVQKVKNKTINKI